jgi:hypothetical protein
MLIVLLLDWARGQVDCYSRKNISLVLNPEQLGDSYCPPVIKWLVSR